jgi:hypothetical protein
VSEIRTWLDGIGLAQYVSAFERNDIDIDLLGQVDDQMEGHRGIECRGRRLRIRNAIAKLDAPAKSESAVSPPVSAGAASAERRQVTVMFSDLVVPYPPVAIPSQR